MKLDSYLVIPGRIPPMKAIINNNQIVISGITDELRNIIEEELTYTDKSKQYQMRRLGKTRWGRESDKYKELQEQVYGKLYAIDNSGSYTMSSCFYDSIVKDSGAQIIDKRKDTGKTIALPWINKPYPLREYQEDANQAMTDNYRGVINYATGLGKTLLAIHFIRKHKKKTLIVCPGSSVASQFYEQLVAAFGKKRVGFYGGGKKQIADITVGIAASVSKYVTDFQKADLGLVLFDETHHIAASTFFEIAQGLDGTGKIFGLTATDYRSDGKDIMITAGCGPVIARRDIKWGIENKWLAEPCFIVRNIATGGKDYKDDKLKSYKEHVLNNKTMKDQILSDARKTIAAGKALLILVDEVAHGQELSEQLGIPFATGLDKKSQDYVDQLNAGKIPGLVGTDGKIGEGSDTRNVDVLILANFVASKGPVIQCIGRALRKQGTKTSCIILDYKPQGSTMLSRHSDNRIAFYKEITDKVIIKS